MPRDDIKLEDFPVHAACPPCNEFYEPLITQLAKEIGLPDGLTNRSGGGYSSYDLKPWTLVGEGVTELAGGIRVRQLKKSAYGDTLMVDYAVFLPDGRALAWNIHFGSGGTTQRYSGPQGAKVFFDAEVKRKVRALIKWKPPAR
jgi:hypothetical protein